MRRLTRKHNTSSTREKHFNDLAHLRSQASPQLTHINNKLIQIYNKNTEIRESAKRAQKQCSHLRSSYSPDHSLTSHTNMFGLNNTSMWPKIKKAHEITKTLPGLPENIYAPCSTSKRLTPQ